ncbi:unnamed protein product [Urochloa decumbens]|uniref:Uncharacterized protein n=1 Tax=Urochloa decumbens TaxID=240449 RepID=A0ABC8YUE2_9POAL
MGNAVPPRKCREKTGTGTAAGRRRPKSVVAPEAEARRAAAVAPRKQLEEGATRRRAGAVSWADGDADAGGKKAPAATVATVKIVLRRKDAEALVARLNAQSARERKARMAEIKGELRAGECCGGGGASPAPCRDAWRPMLAPIKEN